MIARAGWAGPEPQPARADGSGRGQARAADSDFLVTANWESGDKLCRRARGKNHASPSTGRRGAGPTAYGRVTRKVLRAGMTDDVAVPGFDQKSCYDAGADPLRV